MKKFICSVILLLAFPVITFADSGYLWISGCDYDSPYGLDYDISGTGWEWSMLLSKLSLNSSYTGEPIYINYTDVTLEIVGNVTVYGGEFGAPIRCDGNLNVTGTGKLTLVPSDFARENSIATIQAGGNLTFSGAEIITNSEGELNSAVLSEYGDIIFTNNAIVTARAKGTQGYAVYTANNVSLLGNSNLTASGEGTNAAGIFIKAGDLTVNDNAVLTARGIGEGYAVEIREGSLNVNNDNVTLIADDESHAVKQENSGEGTINKETNDNLPEQPEQEDTTKPIKQYSRGGGGSCNSSYFAISAAALVLLFIRKKI